MAKNNKYDQVISFRANEALRVEAAKKGIKPENFRQFIKEFGDTQNGKVWIKSSEWRRLKDILDRVPSLQLIGDVEAGKSYLTAELIKNDKDHVYIVLDSHGGYTFLPRIHQISPHIQESSLLEMHKSDEAARVSFGLYKSLIQYDTYPKHYVLVVDEALRYAKPLELMLAESRKFLKIMTVSQKKLVDFVPKLYVDPYRKIKL